MNNIMLGFEGFRLVGGSWWTIRSDATDAGRRAGRKWVHLTIRAAYLFAHHKYIYQIRYYLLLLFNEFSYNFF